MKAYKVSLFFGLILIFIGLVGFIPHPIVDPQGVLFTHTVHSLVHILAGSLLFMGAILFPRYASWLSKIIGAAYTALAVLSIVLAEDMWFGFIPLNSVDYWLHLGLALAVLITGLMTSDNRSENRLLFIQTR